MLQGVLQSAVAQARRRFRLVSAVAPSIYKCQRVIKHIVHVRLTWPLRQLCPSVLLQLKSVSLSLNTNIAYELTLRDDTSC